MTIIELKERLHRFIDMADERTLSVINSIITSENKEDQPDIPLWFYDELDKRRERHLKEESTSSTWEAVKARTRNR